MDEIKQERFDRVFLQMLSIKENEGSLLTDKELHYKLCSEKRLDQIERERHSIRVDRLNDEIKQESFDRDILRMMSNKENEGTPLTIAEENRKLHAERRIYQLERKRQQQKMEEINQERIQENIDRDFLQLMSIKEDERIPLTIAEENRKLHAEKRIDQLERERHSKRIGHLTNELKQANIDRDFLQMISIKENEGSSLTGEELHRKLCAEQRLNELECWINFHMNIN